MSTEITKLDLFSTPVWIFKSNHLKPANLSFLEAIESGALGTPSLTKRSNRKGARYEFNFLKDIPEEIRTFVLKSLQRILAPEFYVAIESWVNLHLTDGYNVSHMHPGYLLSGVYYVKSNENAGKLVLEDPRMQAQFAANHVFLKEPINYRATRLTPEEGMLVLFPSWLMHHVTENITSESRVSIALNISAHKKS